MKKRTASDPDSSQFGEPSDCAPGAPFDLK
jgi:hypothetical protein